MSPTEFVAGLAEVMGVERTELATVDRALAKGGFRRLARGKSRPDISLEEGVQIALSWAGAQNLTQAAEEAVRLNAFIFFDAEPTTTPGPDFVTVFGGKPSEIDGKTFPEVTARVARSLGTGQFDPGKVWVTIRRGGGVTISFVNDPRRPPVSFYPTGKLTFWTRPGVKVSVAISGDVLKWIYSVTEGA